MKRLMLLALLLGVLLTGCQTVARTRNEQDQPPTTTYRETSTPRR